MKSKEIHLLELLLARDLETKNDSETFFTSIVVTKVTVLSMHVQ